MSLEVSQFDQLLGDRYQVQQQLGKRIGRRTLLAWDRQLQQSVVIKLLTLSKDIDWQDIKLFEREAQTLQSLSYPAIPRYLGSLDIDTPIYKGFALVQSYVEGRSLDAHLKAGRTFSEAEVKKLAEMLLDVLMYLHGRSPSVIHRDIKPSNIILSDDFAAESAMETALLLDSSADNSPVYLVDFGSVQTLVARESGMITVVGTYGYLPPEQFGGQAVPASDLYSLGATLVFLVTGRHPVELAQADVRIQFREYANLSPEFTDWLEWMTEPSLDRRLASAQQAMQGLKTAQLRPQSLKTVDADKPIPQKPFNTKIQLTKTPKSFKAILPSTFAFKESNLLILTLVAFLIPFEFLLLCGSGTVIFSTLNRPSPGGAEGSILLIYGLILFLCTTFVLVTIFKQTSLKGDRHTITAFTQLFELTLRQRWSTQSQAISSVLPMQHHKNESMPPESYIVVGRERHKVAGNMTKAECEWLVYELKDWLGLE